MIRLLLALSLGAIAGAATTTYVVLRHSEPRDWYLCVR